MSLHDYLNLMTGQSTNLQKIGAAHCLEPFTHDSQVMDALCEAAVSTTSHRVRDVLIDVMKTNPTGACIRFSHDALWSKNPAVRKWALVNMSLLGCHEAKHAVINGLHDPDASVRKAAALNAGLYADKEVQNALERYFETHRFDLTLAFIADGFNAIRNKPLRPENDDASRLAVKTRRTDALPEGGH